MVEGPVFVVVRHVEPLLVVVVDLPFAEVAEAECWAIVAYGVEAASFPVVGLPGHCHGMDSEELVGEDGVECVSGEGTVEHVGVEPHVVGSETAAVGVVGKNGIVHHVGAGGETFVGVAIAHGEIVDSREAVENQACLRLAYRGSACHDGFDGGIPEVVGTGMEEEFVAAENEESHRRASYLGAVAVLDGAEEHLHRIVPAGHEEERESIHGYRDDVEEEAVGGVEV